MGVEFKKMAPEESAKLRRALDANALEGRPLVMDPLTTSFILTDEQLESELINAIQSVPVHY